MREGRDYMTTNPGLIVWPGLAIILLVVSLNVVGDWLEQFVNVRRRRV
jgi:peptide/nickel transport system permease protein